MAQHLEPVRHAQHDPSVPTPNLAARDGSVASGVGAVSRRPYRAPALHVHGSAAELTQRNLFAPGRVDGGFWWRRTG